MIRKRTVFPPVSPPPEEFVITRRPWGRTLLFRFAWGESFRLRASDAVKYLELLGATVEDAGRVIDLVWNFRALHYAVATHKALTIPPGTVKEVLGSERESLSLVGV